MAMTIWQLEIQQTWTDLSRQGPGKGQPGKKENIYIIVLQQPTPQKIHSLTPIPNSKGCEENLDPPTLGPKGLRLHLLSVSQEGKLKEFVFRRPTLNNG